MKKRLFVIGVLFASFLLHAEVQFTADTSRPEMSTYALGEDVVLEYEVKGLKEKELKLELNIVDEFGREIEKKGIPISPDENGSWKYSCNAPNKKMGFYRVYSKLSSGMALPKLGSRPAGFITYCIVPDPAKRMLYPDTETFFGMQGGFNKNVNIIPYLGIRWVFGGLAGWKNYEPERPGQFAEKIAKAKQEGKSLLKNGGLKPTYEVNGKRQEWKIYPLASLFFIPKWAAVPGTENYCTGVLTPEGEKAWKEFCFQGAKLQAEEYPDVNERIYQITWEPVYPWGFKGTDKDLVRIYEIAFPAIHSADPRAVVVGPTYSGVGKESLIWHNGLFKEELGKYIDGFSIHPYKSNPPERAGLVENIRSLKDMICQYSGKNIPMFGTEQGNKSESTPEAELDLARGMLRANLIMFGEGYRFNFAFYIVDYYSNAAGGEGFGYCYNLTKISFGADKIAPKPIAPAYAAQSFLLEGHKSSGAIEWLGDTALGYVFERPGSVILALWDYGDKPREVKIQTGTKEADVYDWMGNRKDVSTKDGNLQITLTQEPVYIKGVSATVWGSKAEKLIQLKDSQIKSCPGGEIVIGGKARNTLKETTAARISVEFDRKLGIPVKEQEVKMGSAVEEDFSFKTKIPLDASLGAYPVKVSLKTKEETIFATGLMLRLAPVVTIGQVLPVFQEGGSPGLKIKIKEMQGREFEGTMQTRMVGVPESRRQVDMKIGANEEREIVVPYKGISPSPANIHTCRVVLSTKEGYRTEEEFPVNFFQAKRLDSPITVDGGLSEWKEVRDVLLKGREHLVRSEKYYSGENDLEARVRYGWDETCLYIAYDVIDDVFVQDKAGWDTWKGDCIQLGFDLDYGKEQENTGNTLADAGSAKRISEIDVALTGNGPEAYRTATFDKEKFPIRLLSSPEISLAVKREAGRTVYEAAIPWKTLGGLNPPKKGDVIGAYATINDMDESAQQQQDPSAFGLFIPSTAQHGKQFGTIALE
ncbi:MAG: sugar-binding protein [Victivallales bacterium]